MPVIPANDEAQAFHADLNELLRKHAGHLRAEELLAVSAQVTGQIIAFQDYRKLPVEEAMRIVRENLVIGNKAGCEAMMKAMGPVQ